MTRPESPSRLTHEALNEVQLAANFQAGELAALLKDHGLSEPLYNILRILRGAGPRGLCVQEIAARMITRVPDMTRLLNRLETLGCIGRETHPNDRRSVLVCLSPGGRKMLSMLDGPFDDLHQRLFKRFTREELATLTRLLAKARAAG